ncbi:hypothetical protein BS17DRAFT_776054 [Gyrodon lividus]|nr:hypothetical protein BS17DRAFT_776054 [Gyrodon lividus]
MPDPEDTRSHLSSLEVFWRDRFQFFMQKGYTLRPRYRPNWEPSWRGEVNPLTILYEDGIRQIKRDLLDAKNREGQDVFIKRVNALINPNEFEIAMHLGSPDSQKDELNHCVPVLDSFTDEQQPNYQYIVMPVLRPFNQPDFTSVKEVIDFVDQTLQGLVYMHNHHIAHRDCAAENILMDGSTLYRDGFHPMEPHRTRDGRESVKLSSHRSQSELKYYFIDFGLSTKFDPGRPHLVTGTLGRVPLPERSDIIPYDPFKADVYILGSVFLKDIVQRFQGLDLLGTLVREMTAAKPEHRPTAREALETWQSMRSSMSPSWARLREPGERGFGRILNDVLHLARGSMGI